MLNGSKFNCNCGITNDITPENIIIHIRECVPILNTVEFRCECGEVWALFGMNKQIADSDLTALCVERTEFAPDNDFWGYVSVFSKRVDNVTAKREVLYFKAILEVVSHPDEILWGK